MPKKIELSGVVGYDITAKGLSNRLVKDDKNIVHLDSVGGSVFEGNRLFNLIEDRMKAGYDIEFILGAVAASAASYFPLAVGSKNIKVRENTVFMGHKAWSFAVGNADDLKIEADILDGFDKMIAKVYSKVNGLDIDANLEAMGKEFWLMGGQAVVDAGYASGIVGTDEYEESEGDPDEVALDQSEVNAMIKEAKAVLKEKGQEEDLEQWAAKLKGPIVDEKGQFNMFENADSGKTPGSDKNIIQGENMDFMTYLDQNPEHKAEFEAKQKAFADEKVNAAVSEDRERTAKIVKLYGQSESAVNAIKEGTSVGDLAVAEKENAMAASENAGKDAPDVGGLDKAKDSMPKAVVVDKAKAKNDAAKASVEAYLNKGGKK